MALQDVCGFSKTPLVLRWNSPSWSSVTVGAPHGLDGGRPTWRHACSDKDGCSENSLSPFLLASPSSPSVPLPFSLSHGTTTLAFVFQGGVMVAADTRASCSGLIACPEVHKVMPVHSHLVATASGSGADCMFWQRVLARECRLYQLRNHRRLSVGGAAKLLSHMLHPFKGTKLCVALTLCGWDGDGEEEEDQDMRERASPASGEQEDTESRTKMSGRGPRLYYVCSDGTFLQGELFSVGSGSPYAYAVLDGGPRWGLSVGDACVLAREAVFRATHRDAYSGNCVDIFHISSQGWRRREREDLREEYYRDREQRGRRQVQGGQEPHTGEV
ncbi:proteasome subunit beta type-5 [Scleropages formosus]|uniref:proteasome subunit beta type-5 n=1 Tax=Scleropages formosus TaxID=113540 RepID=UPI003D8E1C74